MKEYLFFIKRYFIFLLLFMFFSCKKKKHEDVLQTNQDQIAEIKDPIVYYDTLGKGDFRDKIRYIKRNQYGFNNFYFFEYDGQSNRVKTIIYEPQRHPQSCAGAKYDFFYVRDKIDRLEVGEPTSACAINVRTFKYNYFLSGALKSIVQQDAYNINEIIFSYSSNGRVDKIFYSYRPVTLTRFRYIETSYSYNSKGNVTEIKRQESYSNTISQITNFEYDSIPNPFKGFYGIRNFIPTGVGYESEGPFFLSENNVRRTTYKYLENNNVQIYPYLLSYTNSRLSEFGYFDQYRTYFYY